MWTGAISFGVMSVPVKTYKAADSEDLSFNNLHKECGGKTGVQKVCRNHGTDAIPITDADIVKGYEISKGKFVTLTDEELKALPLPSKDTITIREFVPAETVDPVYIEGSYYLEAEKGGSKQLALLIAALAERNLAAVGVVSFRKREQLVALRVGPGGVLVLHTLYTEEEVRLAKANVPTDAISDRELQMAGMLIDMQLKSEFSADHTDHYEAAVRQLVQDKLDGKAISAPATPALLSAPLDLEAALAASIAKLQAA